MSVTSLDPRISPLSGRISDSRITPADLVQVALWAALAAAFVVFAITESSIGSALLAVLVLTQVWHAWSSATARRLNDVRDGLAPEQQL
jgi:hypothetical protein